MVVRRVKPVAICLTGFLLATAPAVAQQETAPSAVPPETVQDETLPSSTIEADRDTTALPLTPILTIDQVQLFARSAWGRRSQAQIEEYGRMIAAENDRISQQLSDEEAQLTQQRKTLDPAEFRKRAEAFDARATEIRRARAEVLQDLDNKAEADRAAFYQAALPLMGEMMQARGAVAVLDRRTVLISLDAINITDDLIQRIDTTIGDGADRKILTPDDDPQARPSDAAGEDEAGAAQTPAPDGN